MEKVMLKPLQERLKEIIILYQKLYDLGLNENVCQSINEFKVVANRFVKSGQSESGKIKLKEINRVLVYLLSNQPHIVSSVTLTSL